MVRASVLQYRAFFSYKVKVKAVCKVWGECSSLVPELIQIPPPGEAGRVLCKG